MQSFKIIPIIDSNIETDSLLNSNATSGIRSKANNNQQSLHNQMQNDIKPNILLDGFLQLTPITPPIVVPNVPKNNPS